MQSMRPTISQIDLTSEDSKLLRKKLIAVGLFFVIASGMFSFMAFSGHFNDLGPGVYIFGGFALFFFSIIFYMGGSIALDLFKGEKLVIKGEVLDKIRYKSSSSSGSRRGGRAGRSRGSRSRSSPKFYLKIGDKKYHVDHKHYSQAHVGQIIELHYAKHSRSSLQIITVSDHHVRDKVAEKHTIGDYVREHKEIKDSLPQREKLLSREDLKALKILRNKKARQYAAFIFFLGLMALIFTVAGLIWWVMWIASGILWLVVIFFIRTVVRIFSRFSQEESSGIKLVVLTRVKDKQHHTGSSKGYFLTTDYGTYTVSKEIYESLKGQDQVFLSVGKHTGWLIDVQSRNS